MQGRPYNAAYERAVDDLVIIPEKLCRYWPRHSPDEAHIAAQHVISSATLPVTQADSKGEKSLVESVVGKWSMESRRPPHLGGTSVGDCEKKGFMRAVSSAGRAVDS